MYVNAWDALCISIWEILTPGRDDNDIAVLRCELDALNADRARTQTETQGTNEDDHPEDRRIRRGSS
jgi:hypothetical protein